MSRDESLQLGQGQVRVPRVHLLYWLEEELPDRELPFIVGVLADLAGHRDPDAEPPPDLVSQRRRSVEIHRGNFDQVMADFQPRLALHVPNELRKDGTRIAVELRFRGIEDFELRKIIRQVDPLRGLLEARQRLAELRVKVANHDGLEDPLQRIIQHKERGQEPKTLIES